MKNTKSEIRNPKQARISKFEFFKHFNFEFVSNFGIRDSSLRGGFTVLEALVAISIVLVAIATAFSIAPQGIFAGRYSRNQAVAYSLAQEALEVVHNKRDNKMYYTLDGWLSDQLADPDNGCIEGVCGVNGPENTVERCNPEVEELGSNDCRVRTIERDDNIFYGTGEGDVFDFRTDPSAEPTIFYRTVAITRLNNQGAVDWMESSCEISPEQAAAIIDDVEIEVTAHVWWKEGNQDRNVEVRENLFDWYSFKPDSDETCQ